MRGINWAAGFFLLMMFADFASTLILGDLIPHLESNPLYNWFGLAGIFVLNLGVAALLYYGYKYSERANTRHAFLYALVFVSVIRIFIVYNNIQVFLNPPSLEVAAAIPQAAKTKFYLIKVLLPAVIAFVPAWLAFWLFSKDHNITNKEGL